MGVVNVRTLTELIELRAKESPNKIAFKFIDYKTDLIKTITYQELYNKAIIVASKLQKRIAVGDRVLLIYPPGLDLITALFGCLFAGGVAILVYPPTNTKLVQKIQHIITDAKPSCALCTSDFANKLKQLKRIKFLCKIPLIKYLGMRLFKHVYKLSQWDVEHLKLITIEQSTSENTYIPILIQPQQIALLQYSSGSTNKPKGVVLTHQNLIHNMRLIFQEMCGNSSDHVCCFWLPPYHDMGLIGGILTPILGGLESILLSPMDFLKKPFLWLDLISKYKVTISGGPNFAYAYCIDKVTDKQKKTLDLSSWQMAFCGAEPIHVATANNFYNYFKDCGFRKECFSPCYGLAESTVFVCSSGLNKGHYIDFFSNTSLHNGEVKSVAFTTQDAKALVSVGQPIFNIKIVDPQTHRIVPPETVGEIWIEKNDSTAQGYWNRPELTQEVFLATLQDNALEHYYLRTGDLGFIYNNQLFICGRIKDLIIIHGANIYPQDIEFTVSHAHSSVKDSYVAAFGVDVGEEEKLAIVCGVKEGLDYDSIIHAIHLAVSREHQIPVYCIALIKPGSLPKTTSGKIQRRFSRELLLNGELPLLKLWNANQPLVSNKAVEISNPKVNSAQLSEFIISKIAVKAELKPEAIDVDKPLTELGIDSIGAVELAEELGIFLGKKIDVGLFWDYPTVNMLLAYITQDPDISKLSNISHAYHPGVGKRGIFKKAGKTGILIIHGFSGTPGEMLELGTYLWRENITVAIPQLSGHCGSAKEFKLSNRHDWYRSVLSAYNLLLEHCDQIFISGLSIGGLLGLQLAAEQQKKLSGVILLSPVFFYDGWNMSKFRTNFLMPMIIHTPLRFLTSFKEKSPYGVKDEQVRQAIEVVMQSQIRDFSEQIGIMKISGVSLKEVDRLIRDTKRLLSQVNCPTLVIHSLEDDMASTRNAEFVQREIGTQKIELYYLIDCYHVITLDKKKREVAEKVLSFLKVGDQRPEYKG